MNAILKKCGQCGTTDPSKFWPSRPSDCKDCMTARNQARRDAGRQREYDRKAKFARYGLTIAEYEAMLEVQGGGCAVCGCTPAENKGRGTAKGRPIELAVDHNHATGEVRGLLCLPCNLAVGYLKDDAERAQKVSEYLRGGG